MKTHSIKRCDKGTENTLLTGAFVSFSSEICIQAGAVNGLTELQS